MSISVTVPLIVAFSGVKKRGRKDRIFVNLVDLDVELRELHIDEAVEAIRADTIDGFYRFRVDSGGQFYWQMGSLAVASGHKFSAFRSQARYRPWPSAVSLRDLQPHVPEEHHDALSLAYDADAPLFPPYDPEAFKTADLAAINAQIDCRLQELTRYVVVGNHLFYAVEEPATLIDRLGYVKYSPTEPWQNTDTFRCYSAHELDNAATMEASFNHYNGRAFVERTEVLDDHHISASFLDRRMALLPRWFIRRFWQCLQEIGEFEFVDFVATLPHDDQILLQQIMVAARSIENGDVTDATLNVAEQLLKLSESSRLNFVLSHTDDAIPMIDVLRSEWEAKSYFVEIDFNY
jgi:hypothetical protein